MRAKVLIVNRSSVVSGGGISRSVQERIVEPLARIPNLEVSVLNEKEILLSHLADFDFVIMNRPHSTEALKLADSCKTANTKLFIDLDDIPVLFPDGDSAYLNQNKRDAFFSCLQLADHISCSTNQICGWVQSHYPGISNSIVPTGFDFEQIDHLHADTLPSCENSVVFTNAGSIKLGAFKLPWLNVMKRSLLKHNWKLDVFADFLETFPEGMPYRFNGSVPWLEHKAMLQRSLFPAAVVPLAAEEDPLHSNYAQFKTPVKYIIYGGLGIPAIYSNSSIYKPVVTHGETGWLVHNNEASWEQALEEIMTDSQLANRIRQNAKSDVRTKFDIKKSILTWQQLLS